MLVWGMVISGIQPGKIRHWYNKLFLKIYQIWWLLIFCIAMYCPDWSPEGFSIVCEKSEPQVTVVGVVGRAPLFASFSQKMFQTLLSWMWVRTEEQIELCQLPTFTLYRYGYKKKNSTRVATGPKIRQHHFPLNHPDDTRDPNTRFPWISLWVSSSFPSSSSMSHWLLLKEQILMDYWRSKPLSWPWK